MARSARGASSPDPLGKRALFWAPPARADSGAPQEAATVLPVGKRALYSGAPADEGDAPLTPENPLAARGAFTVRCQRCRQTSRVGLLDLVIFQFPFGAWLPRGSYDRRMTCPSCRRRAWCSVSLRRG